MAAIKQTLKLGLSQQLALTPQLQQSIRFLQLSTLELHEELTQILEANPFLEEVQEESQEAGEVLPGEEEKNTADLEEEGFSLDDWEQASGQESWEGREEETRAAEESFFNHLHKQADFLAIDEETRLLVHVLIEHLDDRGYLCSELPEIGRNFPEIPEESWRLALRYLQSLDPPGTGARSLAECLSLQLLGLPPSPKRALAQEILAHCPEALAARDWGQIRKTLGAKEEEISLALGILRLLKPFPGEAWQEAEHNPVVPDVVARKEEGAWKAVLNPQVVPRVRLHSLYSEIASRSGHSGMLHQHLQEARWVIKSIEQRFSTILLVSQAIIRHQEEYFEQGVAALRPLVLREVAEEVGMHESTVSRVTTQKFLASPQGVHELKYFFSSHISTVEGGACSSKAIRALIGTLIRTEDPKKPFSDAKIAEVLGAQGYVVARRTVAKYRELLRIPAAPQRRRVF